MRDAKTYPYDSKRHLLSLIKSLEKILERDPDQEVDGIAIPVVAAMLEGVKQAKPDDLVVQSVVDLFSADQIGSGDPIRAASMLVVAHQLDAAIGPRPIVIA